MSLESNSLLMIVSSWLSVLVFYSIFCGFFRDYNYIVTFVCTGNDMCICVCCYVLHMVFVHCSVNVVRCLYIHRKCFFGIVLTRCSKYTTRHSTLQKAIFWIFGGFKNRTISPRSELKKLRKK